jgi:hypothetical protein
MRRVSVVGTTGSGKTTFARRLAERLGVPHVECDALAWGPKWTLRSSDTFRALASEATDGEAWVTDGNYGGAGVRDIIWRRADTLVWLDYPFGVIFWRLLRRTLARIRSAEELWPGTGNRETVRGAFFSRESLFVWLLRTYSRRRRQFPELLARPEYAHLAVHRFRRSAEAEQWLEAQRGETAARIPG